VEAVDHPCRQPFAEYAWRSGSAFTTWAKVLRSVPPYTVGESRSAFLVLGFTLHNITEGLAVAAPLTRERPPLAFRGSHPLAGHLQ
jgi:hypothetical protein